MTLDDTKSSSFFEMKVCSMAFSSFPFLTAGVGGGVWSFFCET